MHTTQYFIDEVMLHDLETNLTTELILVRNGIHGFVEKVLAKYELAEQNRGKGLLGIERIPELQEPLDIAYNDYGVIQMRLQIFTCNFIFFENTYAENLLNYKEGNGNGNCRPCCGTKHTE